MKLSVEFPCVSYRVGPGPALRLARTIRRWAFSSVSLNATAIFQAGARSVAAMIDALGRLHARLRAEVG
jgi:hypothetical protein